MVQYAGLIMLTQVRFNISALRHLDTVTQTLSLSFRLLSPRCDCRDASYIHHTEFSPADTPPVILPIGACRSS